MKVVLKKSVKDRFWGADDYDMLDLNPINKALTNYYLPYMSPSPLKSFLLKKLTTFKQMYLYLKVDCEENSPVVKSISWERTHNDNKVDRGKIKGCLTEYFLNIGHKSIQCTTDEEIVCFVQRLEKDVPLVKEYFEVID